MKKYTIYLDVIFSVLRLCKVTHDMIISLCDGNHGNQLTTYICNEVVWLNKE